MFNDRNDSKRNSRKIETNLKRDIEKDKSRKRSEKERTKRIKKRRENKKLKTKKREKEEHEEEHISRLTQKAQENYEDKKVKRKKIRKEHLENKKKEKEDDKENEKTTEPKNPLLTQRYDDSHLPLARRMLRRLSYKHNRKRFESNMNNGRFNIVTKMLNGAIRFVKRDKSVELDGVGMLKSMPQVRYFIIGVSVFITIVMWLLLFIPLIIAIFGAIIILLLATDKFSGIDTEGIDTSGIGELNLSFEGGSSSDTDDNSSSDSGSNKGTPSSVPNDLDWVFPLILPNDTIEYNRGWEIRYGKMHYGIDFGCSWIINSGISPHIYAVDDGTVVRANYNSGWGNRVLIHHEKHNLYTNYAHMQSMQMKVGDKVSKGDVIGLCGTTGNSTGNHLHFEVWTSMSYPTSLVDPHPYIGIKWLKDKNTPAYTRTRVVQ